MEDKGVIMPTRLVPLTLIIIIGHTITAGFYLGVAVMQLVEAGKIELDAPVQRYLPWFRVADEAASTRITVRHLLYHTSGLPEAVGVEYALSGDARPNALEERVRA